MLYCFLFLKIRISPICTRNYTCFHYTTPFRPIPPSPAAMDMLPWLALAVTAAAGWTAAGLLALMLVAHVGWAGIALIGLAVLLVASRQEMTEDSPAPLPTTHMLARQYEDMQEREIGRAHV